MVIKKKKRKDGHWPGTSPWRQLSTQSTANSGGIYRRRVILCNVTSWNIRWFYNVTLTLRTLKSIREFPKPDMKYTFILQLWHLYYIHLLVSNVTRMMYPDEFVEPLVATGTQLEPHMKTLICFLHRDATEISVFVVKWLL